MDITKILVKEKNNDYKQFQEKICHSNYPIIGVKMPILRNIAISLLKKYNYKEILSNLSNEYYETVMLQGIIIGKANVDFDERINLINNFLPKIDCWAICDIFVSNLKFINDYRKEMLKYLRNILNSQEQYYKRVAIVILLTYFVNDEYYTTVLNIVINIESNYYYVKMAIAWAISICLIKYFNETLIFLKKDTDNIDNWIFNKALQKAIESKQLNHQQKEILKITKLKNKDIFLEI